MKQLLPYIRQMLLQLDLPNNFVIDLVLDSFINKHGHEYWTQWVHRVTWTLYGEKVTLYDDPED